MSAPDAPATAGAAPRGLDRLAEAFAVLGIDAPTVEHEAAFTVDDARTLRGTIPGLHTKNLFLKDKKGRLFLVTAPEDAAIDLKQIHHAIGAKGRVSFASGEVLTEVLGILPGSVTPLALINDDAGRVTFVLHHAFREAELVNVHPLRNTATTTLALADFYAFLRHIGREPDIREIPAPA
ncbi:prolyl-tRNA synthetase associated domain-containing protein [Acuticoccus mangrovi]|uniref:prolyl-tRNA synthetase associated domain-containing protein n=1 Tax=Acuticoccus mangrovi TaxID=2796142 RepID=UPI001E63CFE5|nr:prolyl-tRNA synthetase associated domain-containing protein [Acuticoccus mangrovi]